MDKEIKGTIFAIITAIISGFAIPLNKLFVVKMDPTIFTALRALIIGLVFLGIAIYKKDFSKKALKNIDWRYMVAIGIIGGGLAFFLYFSGLKLTTASRGAFLHKTLPIFTTFLALIFLKEKVTKKQYLALILMFLGVGFIYYDKIKPSDLWKNPTTGDTLVLLATFLWAIENVLSKKSMRDHHVSNFIVSFSRMFIGSLFLFSLLFVLGNFSSLLSLSIIQIRNILISTIVLFMYVFFWYSSLKMINVSKASAILLFSPVISMIFGILMFNEPTPAFQLIGSFLILVGGYFVIKTKSEFSQGL